jgi:TetR/AcrR family transcriptional regulator, transcriptional repressor for nem operon
MKVSARRKAEHRAAILEAAGRQVRAKGPAGLGVAAVMEEAGLTHGGFYGHFQSKSALVAETMRHALDRSAPHFAKAARTGDFTRFAARYLGEAHLRDVEAGCPLVAVGAEIARQPPEVQAAFAAALRDWFAPVEGEARARAMAAFSGLVGAMVMARAVAGADEPLAREILSAAKERPAPAG